MAQYQSRIKHSPWKLTRKFGTPTIDGVGIAFEMASSKRKRHMVKCSCCNHWFAPSYHTDVHIPGYDGDKRDISRDNIGMIRWEEAVVLCPSCGRVPSLQPEYRDWVCENPYANLEAVGYYVTPFSVPNVVSTADIVYESTKFPWHEFCNQTLGETNSEALAELTLDNVKSCMTDTPLDTSEIHCMGADMGNICHITIGRLTLDGMFLVVHRERVPMGVFAERSRELKQKYRVLISVFDAFPHTDTILTMQKYDKNLFGAVYHASKKLATYSIVKAEEDADKGKLPITQAMVHRNLNFDAIMGLFQAKKLLWYRGNDLDKGTFEGHCSSMKRKQELDRDGEISYVWHKPANGQDHYFHSLGYLYVACRLMHTAARTLQTNQKPMVAIAMRMGAVRSSAAR